MIDGELVDLSMSVAGAAHWLGVSPTTVRHWADSGHLECTRTKGGHRRFTVEQLNRLLIEQHPTGWGHA